MTVVLKMSMEGITLLLLTYLACFASTNGQNGGNTTERTLIPVPNSPKEMQSNKELCSEMKTQLIIDIAQAQGEQETINRAEIELSAEFQSRYPQECTEFDAFTYGDLTRNEAMNWLQNSADQPNAVYDIARDISQEMLRELIMDASRIGWGMPGGTMAPILQALVDVYIQRLGGLNSITSEQIRFMGSTIVYTIPTNDLDKMPKEVLDTILEHITTATEMTYNPYGEPTFDYAASLASLVKDVVRLKALCRTAWTYYRRIQDDATFAKIWILLWCAPQKVCRDLISVDIVQTNRDTLSGFPLWKCHTGVYDAGNDTEHYENFFKNFPEIPVCGRHIAKKIVGPGENQLVIDTAEKLMGMGNLALCMPYNAQTAAIELVGCSVALDGVKSGVFSKELAKFVYNRCFTVPTDYRNVTCANISSYGPLVQFFPMKFWQKMWKMYLCDSVCMTALKEVELSSDKMNYIMKKCYGERNVSITSDDVQDIGGMVTTLPIDKLDDISADDLDRSVGSIKEELKRARKAKKKKNRRRKAIAAKIARKMAKKKGALRRITDSSDMMKSISLKDFEASLTDNITQDLGINEHEVSLTDSQYKLVMRKIKKRMPVDKISPQDLWSMKSLVKGFITADIKKMVKTRGESGIELAKPLCEQKNWPPKPVDSSMYSKILDHPEAIQPLCLVTGFFQAVLCHYSEFIYSFVALQCTHATHPRCSLAKLNKKAIGHFQRPNLRYNELLFMDKAVCSAVCEKVGYCDQFRCLNTALRRNFLQACLVCKDLGVNMFTEAEMDELGPNLLSELSGEQMRSLVPNPVLLTKIGSLKKMCMNKDTRTAISEKLTEIYGSSTIDFDTLALLGSGAMMFSLPILLNINWTYISELTSTYVAELTPVDEILLKQLKCCESWQEPEDLEYFEGLKNNLWIAVRDAAIEKMRALFFRMKREVGDPVSWTCENVRLVSEAFTTVEDADINNMNDTEFIDCLADIGSLTSWTVAQKTLLLAKTESAFGVSVCSLTTTDLLNLGEIGEAMTTSQISCLPLDEDDIVASFGAMPAWTTDQLGAFATRYLSVRGLADISGFTSSDISLVGHLLCGFTPVQLAAVPAATIGASGSQLGSLSHCPISQLVQLKTVAIDPDAYGPIVNWTAAEVGELKHVLAGLVDTEIQDLSVDALEGLSSEVIPRIPVNTFKEMSVSQLEALTDVQAVRITADQRAAMSADQIAILGEVTTGGEEEEPEVTAAPPSTGSVPDVQSALLLLGTVLIMLLLST